MKNPILILCFIAFTTAIHAQNPRIETIGDRRNETYSFQKGGDSIRFTILGKNDTLQRTYFYRNGHLERTVWKKDSSYQFDGLGRLVEINYRLKDGDDKAEDNISFFENGQQAFARTNKEGVYLEKTFTENGQLILKKSIKSTSDYTYTCLYDRNGVLITAKKTDIIRADKNKYYIHYDTAFYENGKPIKIEIYDHERRTIVHNWFNKDGSLLKSLPPDSLQLVIFKDNIDCYYGLKNKRGDTIAQPRFDHIEELRNDFFLAYTGGSAIILQLNGAPMSTSFSHLTSIESLYPTNSYERRFGNFDGEDSQKRNQQIESLLGYYKFIDNGKYGVMTNQGKIVMTPQYHKIERNYFNDATFFKYYDTQKDSIVRIGCINHKGKTLFSDSLKGVHYTYCKDYYFLSLRAFHKHRRFEEEEGGMSDRVIDLSYLSEEPSENILGLGISDETILLPPKFNRLQYIWSSFFMVSVIKGTDADKKNIYRHGIFNARTKKMILDTTDFMLADQYQYYPPYFVVQHVPTKKYGVVDTTGNLLLPFAYDTLAIIDRGKGLFWVKKGKKYQIATIDKGKIQVHKTTYDFLYPIEFQVEKSNSYELQLYVLAKRANKWGVIDATEKVIKPFNYDYALMYNNPNQDFYLVKDNQVTRYDNTSLPNETPLITPEGELGHYRLIDDHSRVLFANDTGKVVIPPQYKQLNYGYSDRYSLVEDDNYHKKLIFFETSQVIDFPFDYTIQKAEAKSRVIIVKDSTEVSYGVVSTDGKLLVPCNNYGVALADMGTSTFFVKNDTPIMKRELDYYGNLMNTAINGDTLTVEDTNWLMYDGNGKKVSDKPFRFPIDFQNGVGIGMKDAAFNLYQTNGLVLPIFIKVVVPKKNNNKPSISGQIDIDENKSGYKNIRRDSKLGFYTLFYNQGLSPTLILTKNDGEIIVNSGRYDGISRFFGQYALVSDKGKVGLIDSFGREIIQPQDLYTFSAYFMDSLDIPNALPRAKSRKKGETNYSDDVQQPIEFSYGNKPLHPDSLQITTPQRAALWNLLLEKSRFTILQTVSDWAIPRVDLKESAPFVNMRSSSNKESPIEVKRITVADKTIAFAADVTPDLYGDNTAFFNFYYRNNRWNELKINDVLQIQGEKRWTMNDLITQKVKALKDQQIDCSNASAFITTVENRFMLTKEGIDFCFDSTSGSREFVIISFTWAELTPFLKMKIY